MADPLSITAGVVGIVTAALQATGRFAADLQRLSEAPATIESLKQDIAVLAGTLKALAGLEGAQWKALGTTVTEQSKATVASCTVSCDKYMADLQRWTRHSSPGRGVAVRDRLALALWRESQVKNMSEQLQKYRTTLNLVISTAALYSSMETQHDTQALKAALGAKTADVTNSISATNQDLLLSHSRLQQMVTGSAPESTVSNANDTMPQNDAETRHMEADEEKLLRVLLKLLDELRLSLQDKAKAINEQERTQMAQFRFGDNNSGIQLGYNYGGLTFHGSKQ